MRRPVWDPLHSPMGRFIGIDITDRTAIWATHANGKWIWGALPDPSPRTLEAALGNAACRDRTLALAIPTDGALIGLLPVVLKRICATFTRLGIL